MPRKMVKHNLENEVETDNAWTVSAPVRTLRSGIAEVYKNRLVLYALVRRDLSARYRASALGFAWASFKPLLQMIVFSVVFGLFLGAGRQIQFYSIFLFVGLLVWGFISESISSGTSSITNGAALVTKASFPREILPFAAICTAGFNFLVQLPVLLGAYVFFDVFPSFDSLARLLVLLPSLLMLVTAAALFLSALNVFARDVQHLVELILMLLLYLSPIVYSWVFVYETVLIKMQSDLLFRIYMMNPISSLVVGFQEALWPGIRKYSSGVAADDLLGFDRFTIWLLPALGVLTLVAAYRFFLNREPDFAREL